MRISVDEARDYFSHPSQQVFGITPDTLPDDPFEYWASGPFCGVVHPFPYRGIWMVHFAAKPEGRGGLVPHAKAVMREFWEVRQPERLIGMTPVRLRAACAFVRRLGFVQDGILPLPDGDVVLSGWRLTDGN